MPEESPTARRFPSCDHRRRLRALSPTRWVMSGTWAAGDIHEFSPRTGKARRWGKENGTSVSSFRFQRVRVPVPSLHRQWSANEQRDTTVAGQHEKKKQRTQQQRRRGARGTSVRRRRSLGTAQKCATCVRAGGSGEMLHCARHTTGSEARLDSTAGCPSSPTVCTSSPCHR